MAGNSYRNRKFYKEFEDPSKEVEFLTHLRKVGRHLDALYLMQFNSSYYSNGNTHNNYRSYGRDLFAKKDKVNDMTIVLEGQNEFVKSIGDYTQLSTVSPEILMQAYEDQNFDPDFESDEPGVTAQRAGRHTMCTFTDGVLVDTGLKLAPNNWSWQFARFFDGAIQEMRRFATRTEAEAYSRHKNGGRGI